MKTAEDSDWENISGFGKLGTLIKFLTFRILIVRELYPRTGKKVWTAVFLHQSTLMVPHYHHTKCSCPKCWAKFLAATPFFHPVQKINFFIPRTFLGLWVLKMTGWISWVQINLVWANSTKRSRDMARYMNFAREISKKIQSAHF